MNEIPYMLEDTPAEFARVRALAAEGWGHAGLMDDAEILDRVRRGLPAYVPKDPVNCDQRRYRAFAAERGPNSE